MPRTIGIVRQQANLNLKTQPKQLLGYLLLAFGLPASFGSALAPSISFCLDPLLVEHFGVPLGRLFQSPSPQKY
jgi:hypothetical protein